MQQTSFANLGKTQAVFGGGLLGPRTNPKGKRPLDSKLPIHLVLRARRSVLRLPKHIVTVNRTVKRVAVKYGVRIYEYANVGNHLHLCLRVPRRNLWAKFIRELTSVIARLVNGEKWFWLGRPFTRVVAGWRKAYRAIRNYVRLNQLEAEGVVTRRDLAVLKEIRKELGEPPMVPHAYFIT